MKTFAHRLYGTRDLRFEETLLPPLGDVDVLVSIRCCGVCGTDCDIYTGSSGFVAAGMVRYPMTPGHEFSGVVSAVGSKVIKFAKGDRVVADTCVSCGVCEQCLKGEYGLCPRGKSVGTINCHDGGMARHAIIPERHLFPLPDNLSFDAGALAEPASTALYALSLANPDVGDTVLVTGTGPIGLAAVAFAVKMGASRVISAGRKPFKLAMAQALGATHIIDTTSQDLVQSTLSITGGAGVQIVIEASGSTDILSRLLACVDKNARLSLVAFYNSPLNELDLDSLIINRTSIIPVPGSPNMMPKVLRMFSAGAINLEPIITDRLPLSQAGRAYDMLLENRGDRIKVLLENDVEEDL